MRTFARLLLAGAGALLLHASAGAASHGTSLEARGLLEKAVAELKAAGPDKAFAEFDAAHGAYKFHDLYVFVFSMNGTYEASGANPKLVGTNARDLTDVEGKPFVREAIAVAKTNGSGRVDYIWLNRADNRVEHKRSLVQRVGDHIVGVGYYAG